MSVSQKQKSIAWLLCRLWQ